MLVKTTFRPSSFVSSIFPRTSGFGLIEHESQFERADLSPAATASRIWPHNVVGETLCDTIWDSAGTVIWKGRGVELNSGNTLPGQFSMYPCESVGLLA